MTTVNHYQKYSTGIKALVASNLLHDLDLKNQIPYSTRSHWKRSFDINEVLKLNSSKNLSEIIKDSRIKELENKVNFLETKIKFIKAFLKTFGIKINKIKPTDPKIRNSVVNLIKEFFPKLGVSLKEQLSFIDFSESRFKKWCKESSGCMDINVIPSHPRAIRKDELEQMKKYVESKEHAHYSLPSLRLVAARSGDVLCCMQTWYKYIKICGWSRPFNKIFKKFYAKGVRATAPNQIWHIDTSYLCKLNGIKYYLQAVVDNFSILVLSWTVTTNKGSAQTVLNLKNALKNMEKLNQGNTEIEIYMDPGSENTAKEVTNFIREGPLKRILARIDVRFSNSMIESVFRKLKHDYLKYCVIKTKKDLIQHVKFYFNEACNKVPLKALNGGIPIEVYTGKWTADDIEKLKIAHQEKLEERIELNMEDRKLDCGQCVVIGVTSHLSKPTKT